MQDAKASSGYVHVAYAQRLAEAAGLRLAAASEVNANPLDTADHEGGVWALPPSFANKDRDREVKLTLYSRRGVREYWIIDRFTRTIAVHRRTAAAALELAATLTDRDTLTSPLLPGFALPVAQLFQLPEALRGR